MKRTTALDYLYLGTYHLFRGFVLYTPESIRFAILKGLARLAYLIDRRHRRVAFVNLDIAFGDTMSEKEKKRIVKKTYENLILNLADFIRSQEITPEALQNQLNIEGLEYLENARKSGRPIVFMSAHFGPWELLPYVASLLLEIPMTVVGRPLDSPAMNEILKKHREQFNIRMIPKKKAMRPLIQALKEGRGVGLLIDQHTSKEKGYSVTFFGQTVTFPSVAAILSQRLNALIIPVFIEKEGKKHYRVRFESPLEVPKKDPSSLQEYVQKQATIIEKTIRRKPDEWFWLHRRWKECCMDRYRSVSDAS